MNDEMPKSNEHWLVNALLQEYSHSGDYRLAYEFLEFLTGFERKVVLGALFWHALGQQDWRLAELCIREGYPIVPCDQDPSDWGPLNDALTHFGDVPDVVEWLLEQGADIERRGPNNVTPLILAALAGYEAVVAKLLAHSADVNASTQIDDDMTPLMAAARAGHFSLVKALLACGADPNQIDRWGTDAAQVAELNGHHDIADFIRSFRATAHRSRRRSGVGQAQPDGMDP